MGAKRLLVGIVVVLLGVVAVGTATGCILQSAEDSEPVLLSSRPVLNSDLPVGMQGMSDARLREQLDELLEHNAGDRPELWWSPRLEVDELEAIRLLSKHLGDDRTAVRSLLWLGEKLRRGDKYGEALKCLDQAQAEAEALGYTEERAQAHGYRGDCLKSAGLYYSAIEEHEKALAVYTELDLPVRMSWTYSRLAHTQSHRLYDYEKASEYYRRIMDLGDRLEPAPLSNYQMMYALNLISTGRYPETVDAFEAVVPIARNAERQSSVNSALDWADRMRILTNDPEINGFPLVRTEYDDVQDTAGQWQFGRYMWLTEFVSLLEDRQQAADFFQGALEMVHQFEASIAGDPAEVDRHLKAIASERIAYLAALGNLSLRENDYNQALRYFQRADSYMDHDADFIHPRERMELNLAKAYIGLQQYDEALEQLNAAREERSEFAFALARDDDPVWMLMLAKCYMELGNLDEAQLWLDSAEEVIPDISTSDTLRQLAKLNSFRGDLAAERGDGEAEYQYRNGAFHQYAASGSMFRWNSGYRHGLAEEIEKAAEMLLPMCRAEGDLELADEVEQIVLLAQRARELEFAPIPEDPDEFTRLLLEYRGAVTQLGNLRRDSYQLFNQPEPDWNQYLAEWGLDRSYYNELQDEHGKLKESIRKRIGELWKKTNDLASQMEAVHIERASVVFLGTSSAKELSREPTAIGSIE